MRKVLFFILMVLGLTAYAQTAQSTQIEFDKVKVSGVSVTIAGYELEFVQNALQFRLETVAGLKGKTSKGFRMYESQVFHDFGFVKYDIFTSIDKGDKKNQFVTINMLVRKGTGNFANPEDDSDLTDKMKDFLTYFANDYLKEHQIKQKIDELTKKVKSLEKECTDLTNEIEKMKKERTALENKISGKETDFSKKSSELQKAKSELEDIK